MQEEEEYEKYQLLKTFTYQALSWTLMYMIPLNPFTTAK